MASEHVFEWPSYTKTVHRAVYPRIDPSNPANSAAGKVVVVTGGSAGIGKAIAQAFVTAGAKAVAILGRRESVLNAAKQELESASKGTQIRGFLADVTDEKALEAAFASTANEFGSVDVVLANAGYIAASAPATEAQLEDYFKAFEINLRGTLLTFRAFKKHAGASPVFISVNSAAAHGAVFPGMSSYSVSKLALAQLVTFLQVENPDFRVASFHPGVIETEMASKMAAESDLSFAADEISLPSSFAVWLASPSADFINGLYLWAHWDVDELVKAKDQINEKGHLRLGLAGFPQYEKPVLV